LSVSALEAFRAELTAIAALLPRRESSLVRDEGIKERVRNLLRAWSGSVAPSLRDNVTDLRPLLKIRAELEQLAKLCAKQRQARDYTKRLTRTLAIVGSLVVLLPPALAAPVPPPRRFTELFSQSVPDLPLSLVPNSILGWKSKMEAFLGKYPFDSSVFVMIRYRRRNDTLIQGIKKALKKRDLTAVVAADHDLTDDLYNPIACLLCCAHGLAVFDKAEDSEKFNPNVAYELGMLHLLGRQCLILKHQSLKTLQTDILMKLYREYRTIEQAGVIVGEWSARLQGLAVEE